MRILLAHNSLYFPSYGGGDKSNRLLMQDLAAHGHTVRVAARLDQFGPEAHRKLLEALGARGLWPDKIDSSGIRMTLKGVDVRVLSRNPHLRAFFSEQVHDFDPDTIITSTDDPAHLLLHVALRAPRARVVHLVRAMVAAPFGPDSAMPSAAKTEALRRVDGMVAVSQAVADYVRRWSGLECAYVPISLLEPGECPVLGRFANRFVLIVNPCAVKGISIFLALADTFPKLEFAAIPTWGTTAADLDALKRRPNISVLPPVDDFDEILAQTRVVLVPSLWAEARSRVILEAMSRGIPVMASNVGGLAEAKLGVDYLLPVNPVVRFQPAVDELMVPIAEVPDQDIRPWQEVLLRLTGDRAHYDQLAADSRRAALEYVRNLNAGPFGEYLETVLRAPRRRDAHAPGRAGDAPAQGGLSADRRRLLALRLKRTGPAAAKLPPGDA